jgi:hypothetical protein
MNTCSTDYPAQDLRVSDAERDRAIAELSEHFQAGRLTAEELDERTGRALTARTGAELTALFTDLPRTGQPRTGQPWTGQSGPTPMTGPHVLACAPGARAVIAVALIAAIALSVAKPAAIVVPVLVALLILRRRWHGRAGARF